MAIKGPHVHMKPFSRNWIHYTIPEYTKSIKLTMTTGGGMGGVGGGGCSSQVMWTNYLRVDDLLTKN